MPERAAISKPGLAFLFPATGAATVNRVSDGDSDRISTLARLAKRVRRSSVSRSTTRGRPKGSRPIDGVFQPPRLADLIHGVRTGQKA
jgi:hypothetical protein